MESDGSLLGLFGPSGKAVRCCTADNHIAAIGDNCKQYPSKMADSYAINYDVMSYLLFYIYAVT